LRSSRARTSCSCWRGFRIPGEDEQSNTDLVQEYASLLDDIRITEAGVAKAALDLDAVITGLRMAEATEATAATVDRDPEAAARLAAETDKVRQTQIIAQERLNNEMSVAQRYRDAAEPSLRYLRAEMRRRGMVLPALPPSLRQDMTLPALPPSLKLDEDSGPGEGIEAG
jgi:hypothetical protein